MSQDRRQYVRHRSEGGNVIFGKKHKKSGRLVASAIGCLHMIVLDDRFQFLLEDTPLILSSSINTVETEEDTRKRERD